MIFPFDTLYVQHATWCTQHGFVLMGHQEHLQDDQLLNFAVFRKIKVWCMHMCACVWVYISMGEFPICRGKCWVSMFLSEGLEDCLGLFAATRKPSDVLWGSSCLFSLISGNSWRPGGFPQGRHWWSGWGRQRYLLGECWMPIKTGQNFILSDRRKSTCSAVVGFDHGNFKELRQPV